MTEKRVIFNKMVQKRTWGLHVNSNLSFKSLCHLCHFTPRGKLGNRRHYQLSNLYCRECASLREPVHNLQINYVDFPAVCTQSLYFKLNEIKIHIYDYRLMFNCLNLWIIIKNL